MSNEIIQAQYDILEELAGRFGNEATVHEAMRGRIADQVDGLRNGGWEGEGAAAFFQEIDQLILPAVDRLCHAMTEAQSATMLIRQIIYSAEEDAISQFQEMTGMAVPFGGGLSGSGNVGASISGATANIGGGGGFLKGAGDFFSGMWAEGKDMVTGLYTMVTDPVGTAKGLWHAITHPAEAWEAIKQPYVEDWNNGRPWRAIGRGTMAIVTTVLGTKGADKVAKVGSVADDIGRLGGVADDIGRLGGVADDVGRTGGLADDIGRVTTPLPDRPLGGRGPVRLDTPSEWGTHMGQASGRPFNASLDRIGLPIEHLTTEGVEITARGIDDVVHHTSRFGADTVNEAAIQRLRDIADGKIQPTQYDLNFYTHELRELERYKALGYDSGVPTTADAQHRLWNDTHTATLEDYGITDRDIYHPSLLD